ncbi:MAG: hypothetical protein LCH76_15490 [Actinobacteria bacterium]|nr:hypothetical protein [Actinomycetota bacterium]
MRSSRRSALVALLAAVALAGVVTSSAATLGGAVPGALGGAQASTQRITGINLEWTPVASGSTWTADAVTVTTDPGESFLAGDRVKLTIDRSDAADCELTTTAAAGDSVRFGRAALTGSCQTLAFGDIGSIAVAVTGDDLATTLGSSLGDVRGTLAAFSGAVVDLDRTLKVEVGTGKVTGVTSVTSLSVDVAATGLTAADLAGAHLIARLSHSDTQASFDYSGTVSLDGSAPIHITSAGGGTATIAIAIDPVRLADVNRFGIVLSSSQHLGASRSDAPGAYAISTVTGTIAGSGSDDDPDPTPAVSSALDPVALDQRLSYSYQLPANFDGNSLGFCHNFTITNTSSQPVDWTLTFDTSQAPLWGFDPTAANAFSSTWNWETVSYDAARHQWTIRGTAGMRTVQPGATLGTMGYCVQNVPVPPVDPTKLSSTVTVLPSSGQYWVQLSLSVTSSSHWNLPWEITIDLADQVCAAGLQGASLQWHSGIEVTKLDATRYTLRGRAGSNTRFISASRPIALSPLLGYAPTGGQYQLPCGKSARTAISRATAQPEATPSPEAAPEPSEPTVTEPSGPTVIETSVEPATPTVAEAPIEPMEPTETETPPAQTEEPEQAEETASAPKAGADE